MINKMIRFSGGAMLLIFLMVGISASAQVLTLEEKEIALEERAIHNAVQLLCELPIDDVRSAFDEYMDDYHDVKMNTGNLFGKHRIIEAEGIRLDAVSTKEMNLYARIVEQGSLTELSAFGTFGPDVLINKESYPEAYEKLSGMVMDFTSVFVSKYFRSSILEVRNTLNDIADDITDAEKDIVKNNRKIEKLKEDNLELDAEIINWKSDSEKQEQVLTQLKEERSSTTSKVNAIRVAKY